MATVLAAARALVRGFVRPFASVIMARLPRARRGGALDVVYRHIDWDPPHHASVVIHLRAKEDGSHDPSDAREWLSTATLAESVVVATRTNGDVEWIVGDGEPEGAGWFSAPGGLHHLSPAFIETALLVAMAEQVDAVVMRVRIEPSMAPDHAHDAVSESMRPWALYRAGAYAWDSASDVVRQLIDSPIVKYIDTGGVGARGETREPRPTRRGPYLLGRPSRAPLEIRVRDASKLPRRVSRDPRPTLLVTAPFLARGGAEHTMFETLALLESDVRLLFATLAPHRSELGDRRADFEALSPNLYCLGDLVHPDAMQGILLSLIDAWSVAVWYNANGTTIFYDLVASIRRSRPRLRIVDHLYDHRVGYVDRYRPELLPFVDACIAENHRVQDELVTHRGWPADRVPVVWPCGRRPEEFPADDAADDVRRRIRGELGLEDDDVVLMTAARMHAQKRPLDLVEIARRTTDLENLHFLVVGGGPIEAEVDRAIADHPAARIRRLAFRPDIPDLLAAADFGCLVSEYEGLPVFLLECLQAGRPFLGTAVGDVAAVLAQTGAGVVVDRPGDLDALEAAVRRLATKPEDRGALAANARTAGARFAPAACARAYLDVLCDGVT